jgi:hypothetical protein
METFHDAVFTIAQECLKSSRASLVASKIQEAAEKEYAAWIEKNNPEGYEEISQLVSDAFEEIYDLVKSELQADDRALAVLQEALNLLNIEDISQDIADDILDTKERDRDPYAYYGVSRSDFY